MASFLNEIWMKYVLFLESVYYLDCSGEKELEREKVRVRLHYSRVGRKKREELDFFFCTW
jgi:hypothetical protein